MTIPLRQSTAVEIKIGPFVDSTDGFTPETALGLVQADIRLAKNEGDWAQKGETTSPVHEENGWYRCLLNTTDTGTLGVLKIAVNKTGALPWWDTFVVIEAAKYDWLYGTGSLTTIAGSLATQAKTDVNAEVVDALNVDTYAQPGQDSPPATASLARKIGDLHKWGRNPLVSTETEQRVMNDAGDTVDQKAPISTSSGVTTRGKLVTGP